MYSFKYPGDGGSSCDASDTGMLKALSVKFTTQTSQICVIPSGSGAVNVLSYHLLAPRSPRDVVLILRTVSTTGGLLFDFDSMVTLRPPLVFP